MIDSALGVSSTGGFFVVVVQEEIILSGLRIDWRLATGDLLRTSLMHILADETSPN